MSEHGISALGNDWSQFRSLAPSVREVVYDTLTETDSPRINFIRPIRDEEAPRVASLTMLKQITFDELDSPSDLSSLADRTVELQAP